MRMNAFIKSLLAPSVAVLLLGAQGALGDVLAQEQPAEQPQAGAAPKDTKTEVFGSWTVVCSTGEKKRCVAQQQLANAKNNQVLAAAAVRIGDSGAELILQTPSGVVIAPGVTLSVDSQETAKAPFTACAPRACEAIFKIDQNLINSLAKGKSFIATVQSLRGKNVNIEFQLDGFVKAYAAFKKGVTN